LPLRHVGGFGVAARACEAQCRFSHFGRRWDPPGFCSWLAEQQVTHTSLVPAQVHDLVAAGSRAPETLRAVVVGGGRLDTSTGRAARALGWPVLASYGMTEAASQIATQRLDALASPYEPTPLPLLPVWRVEIDAAGRLCIDGPALFSGRLECRKDGWILHAREPGWFRTGDRARLDAAGITPLGRVDSLVKVLGELVDLGDVESELSTISQGALTPGCFAVIAIPDPRAEHALVPVFDAALDPAVVAAALAAHAAETPGFRRLRPAVILEHFPRGALGKPRRGEIHAMLQRQKGKTGWNS
jgi:O-succinylbenzoic acid--CoA ligase